MKRWTLLLPLAVALAACGDDSPTGPTGTKPVADSIAPASGTVGTEVRIYGSGFGEGTPKVFFDTLESTRVEVDGNTVYTQAPAGLVEGATYSIRVVNPAGRADTLASAFTAVAPSVARVNGATKPTGLVGMTVIIEGSAFGDAPGDSKVYFAAADGTPIEAVIADGASDWTDRFIVTSVPQSVGDSSWIWIETPTGVSDSVEFRLIQSGTFSPSQINWTKTTPLPVSLQGLGAVFVGIEEGAAPASYVFALGGADSTGAARGEVYRALVQQTGALESWTQAPGALLEPVAYGATAAATPFTAALDSATAAVLYVVGGKDTTGTTVATVQYARVGLSGDVVGWQAGPSLPAPRHAGALTVFRGYLYFAGGADAADAAQAEVWRARIGADGSLGEWEAAPSLPVARSHFSLVNFGPYVYAIGGEAAAATPTRNATTGTETADVHLSRIDLRTGELGAWEAVTAMGKARSKHGAVFAGGALFVTSGVYSGQPGSSENTYAGINNDGTLGSWNGATGSETIAAETGFSVYNLAVVTFIDASGVGHVLVLGGATRLLEGVPTSSVLYY